MVSHKSHVAEYMQDAKTEIGKCRSQEMQQQQQNQQQRAPSSASPKPQTQPKPTTRTTTAKKKSTGTGATVVKTVVQTLGSRQGQQLIRGLFGSLIKKK